MGAKYSVGYVDEKDLEPAVYRQERDDIEYFHMEFSNLRARYVTGVEISLSNKFPRMKNISLPSDGYKDVNIDKNRIYVIYYPDTLDVVETPVNE